MKIFTLYLTTLFFLRLALWFKQQTVDAELMPTIVKMKEKFLMKGKEPKNKKIFLI
jgi:hypothetical protein